MRGGFLLADRLELLLRRHGRLLRLVAGGDERVPEYLRGRDLLQQRRDRLHQRQPRLLRRGRRDSCLSEHLCPRLVLDGRGILVHPGQRRLLRPIDGWSDDSVSKHVSGRHLLHGRRKLLHEHQRRLLGRRRRDERLSEQLPGWPVFGRGRVCLPDLWRRHVLPGRFVDLHE